MKCSKCLKDYDDSFAFCPHCSAANPHFLATSPTVQPPSDAPPQMPTAPPSPPIPAAAPPRLDQATEQTPAGYQGFQVPPTPPQAQSSLPSPLATTGSRFARFRWWYLAAAGVLLVLIIVLILVFTVFKGTPSYVGVYMYEDWVLSINADGSASGRIPDTGTWEGNYVVKGDMIEFKPVYLKPNGEDREPYTGISVFDYKINGSNLVDEDGDLWTKRP